LETREISEVISRMFVRHTNISLRVRNVSKKFHGFPGKCLALINVISAACGMKEFAYPRKGAPFG
jgi:hypothetical protein